MNNTKKHDNSTWNLTHLFKSDTDSEMETYKNQLEKDYQRLINKWKGRIDYLEKPVILKEALDDYEELCHEYSGGGKLGYYFSLRTAQDSLDTELKAKENKTSEFLKKLSNEVIFFTFGIAKIKPELQQEFLDYEPLKPYRHYLEMEFDNAKYLLSEPEEKLLNLLGGPSFGNWTQMTESFLNREERSLPDESGKKSKKNFNQMFGLISSTNKKVRDTAVKALNEILEKYIEIGEHEMNSILQVKKIGDELRKLDRPDRSRHISDDIETEVVDQLVKTVSNNFQIAQDYYQLKAQVMGVPKLEYHERNVPIGEISKKYTYEEGLELISKTFKKLDNEFYEIVNDFVKNGLVDVYPRKGKRGGAFCAYGSLNTPTYVLLNHNGELNDVLTIAHEFGHGINDEMMKKKQNALTFGTPTSTAEVASTFMEDFVLEEILHTADDELRFAILMNKLNDDVSTIFRQIAFYNFEWDLHHKFREKGYLSKEEIGDLFQHHMKSYMGDYVDHPESSKNWWLYINHFRYFFYVYSYAGGLLISKSLQNFVKNDSKFIEKVKEFLSAGESESPKDIFMKMGVDISQKDFWDKGMTEIKVLLQETTVLAKKLGKI